MIIMLATISLLLAISILTIKAMRLLIKFIGLIVVGMLLLLWFLKPELIPSQKASRAHEQVMTKKNTAVPVTVQIRLPTKEMSKSEIATSSGSNQDFKLPYIEGNALDVHEYLRLVLDRGGNLILSKGAKFTPMAEIAIIDNRLTVSPLQTGYSLPHRIGRDSTEDVIPLLGHPLPAGATRAILFWPAEMQRKLEALIKASPLAASSELKATYKVNRKNLIINFSREEGENRDGTSNYSIVL